jgi:hypothetical protein
MRKDDYSTKAAATYSNSCEWREATERKQLNRKSNPAIWKRRQLESADDTNEAESATMKRSDQYMYIINRYHPELFITSCIFD